MRVIGAGYGRTGTNSLKMALEMLLGEPCYHMFELFQRPADVATWQAAVEGEPVDWTAMFEGWGAVVDWPAAPLFEELASAFPTALVLHSIRPADVWWKSADSTIFDLMRKGGRTENPLTSLVQQQFARDGIDVTDRDATMAAFARHNDKVRAVIPAERRLEWQPGDGWEPICAALGVSVPSEPFPHANASANFTDTVDNAREGNVERGI